MYFAERGDVHSASHNRNGHLFCNSCRLDSYRQICIGLKHVHDRKILHRDIKAQNSFLTKTNRCLLGDFGIAKILNSTQGFAKTTVGTPYYLSPEIIERKNYSFQSDIWSLGVLLYQLCALKHPFDASNIHSLAIKIASGIYPPIPSHYSRDLKTLVSQMLTVKANKRPSIHQILKMKVIQVRTQNFLNETQYNSEFSHTILHKIDILKNKENGRDDSSPYIKKLPIKQENDSFNPDRKIELANKKYIEQLKPEQNKCRKGSEIEKPRLHILDRKQFEKNIKNIENEKKHIEEEKKEKRQKEIEKLKNFNPYPILQTPRVQVKNPLNSNQQKVNAVLSKEEPINKKKNDKGVEIKPLNLPKGSKEYNSEHPPLTSEQRRKQKQIERENERKRMREEIKQQRKKIKKIEHDNNIQWSDEHIPEKNSILPINNKPLQPSRDTEKPIVSNNMKEIDNYILMCKEMEKIIEGDKTPNEYYGNDLLTKLTEESTKNDSNRDDMNGIFEENNATCRYPPHVMS